MLSRSADWSVSGRVVDRPQFRKMPTRAGAPEAAQLKESAAVFHSERQEKINVAEGLDPVADAGIHKDIVELRGVEPLTSSMPLKRSPN